MTDFTKSYKEKDSYMKNHFVLLVKLPDNLKNFQMFHNIGLLNSNISYMTFSYILITLPNVQLSVEKK